MKTIEEYLKEEGFKPNKYGAFIAKISGYDFNIEMIIRDYATEAIKADREKARFELRSKGSLYQDEQGFYIPAEGVIANLPIELP